MEQENRNQQNAAPQVSLGDQIKVRREKLAQLQAEGMDPFAITRFVSTTTAQEIKDHFDEMEGKPVSIAGRLMSKRGMGKVSFCDLQDKTGRIQLYARKDEMDEAEYNRFKKYDIGDIVGVEGESSVGAAFGEGVAVRDGDAGDRRPGAFDRASDRAGRNGCAEAADEQQDNESFHGFGRFWVSF